MFNLILASKSKIRKEILENNEINCLVEYSNVDENPITPQKFGVRGIPTLMLFKDGNLLETKVGSLPKNMLESWLDQNL